MKSETSGAIFNFHALGRRGSVAAVVPASYLAVHELKVDSFQCDLEEPAFAALHVLDGKLSAQLRTCRKRRLGLDGPADSKGTAGWTADHTYLA